MIKVEINTTPTGPYNPIITRDGDNLMPLGLRNVREAEELYRELRDFLGYLD